MLVKIDDTTVVNVDKIIHIVARDEKTHIYFENGGYATTDVSVSDVCSLIDIAGR